MLRWTLLGPLIGTVFVSPLVWLMGSPFDHGIRSFEMLIYTLPITYLIGLPPAVMTGATNRLLRAKVTRPNLRRLVVLLIGAGSSAYLLWIFMAYQLYAGEFSWDWLPLTAVFLVTGSVATAVLLVLERRDLRD